ncbi:MAG: ABC transporter ATP-binding protein [Chloroflexota bacterium]|nr:ABC transporter ATP-binding protein [Chloroflexota bacterium]MDE2942324.1 ABC transporter ATP-binding protein [Chloroflexota bacterium]MDE3268271.1 ABC transporter ATP-binding protein [Chloroflexota bacterium]
MTNGALALEGRGLTQSFGARSVLSGVDVELHRGEVLAIVGASGSGKSTLLYALAGLRQPDGGTVSWGDHADIWNLREPHITLVRRATCGFVFQFPAFLDDLTVAANVAVPLVVSGAKPRQARDKARSLLELFGLSSLTEEYPATLSGGELQRASIARALTMEPSIVFCDEPTGALDEENSRLVVEELQKVASEFGVGVLIVTHDPFVWGECDRVLRLHQGRLVEERGAA